MKSLPILNTQLKKSNFIENPLKIETKKKKTHSRNEKKNMP